ncbi:hypothetical protein INT44_004283 [Umbelopsis vinacea]|uniref:Uncharacterized protein n=1 Tax=Umbelopsis vinacea TaxID=44442 RepID=A0A8H7UKA5_9FUNG|nr:hypothetical protein INT44_004283 [Umbelopsis vinacea]
MDRYPPYSGRGSYDDRYKGYHSRPRDDLHRSHDGYREPDYRDRDGGRHYPPYMRSPPRRPSESGRPFRDHSPPPPPHMRSRYRSRSPPPHPSYRSPPPYRERSHYPPPPYHSPYRSSSGSPYTRRPPPSSSIPPMSSHRQYAPPSGPPMAPSPIHELRPSLRGPSGPPPPPPPLSHHHHSRPNSPGPYPAPPPIASPHPRTRVSIAPLQEKEIRRQEEDARKLQVEELSIISTMRKKNQDLMLAAWEVDKAEHQLELVQHQWQEGNLDSVLDNARFLAIH